MTRADKVIRCECGFEAREAEVAAVIAAAMRHARQVHGMDFTEAQLLTLATVDMAHAGVAADNNADEEGLTT